MKKGKIHVNNGSEIDRLSNEELRNCSYFCLECFRSWGYFRKRTNDYVCRHDGYITTVDEFKKEVEKIIERRKKYINKELANHKIKANTYIKNRIYNM